MSSLIMDHTMNGVAFNPPRENKRIPFKEEVILWKGATFQARRLPRASIVGRAQNVSNGGICLITKSKLEVHQFLRLAFKLKSVPINIPTLVEVRWVEKMPDSHFRVGARFIY